MHGGRELGGKWSRDLVGQVLVARPNAFSPSPSGDTQHGYFSPERVPRAPCHRSPRRVHHHVS